jgi:hypothetical protein
MARRCLGLLALLALRGLDFLALLAIGLGGPIGRRLGSGRLAGSLDRVGGERDRGPYGVVERRTVMLGSGRFLRVGLGDDVAGRQNVICGGRRVFW